MIKRIILMCLSVLMTIFVTSCTGISQDTYNDAITQLNSMNTKYAQTRQENVSLKAELEDSSNNLEEIQTQLMKSEQTISTLNAEIDKLNSLPLETDVEIYTGTLYGGGTYPINYFDRIEGKIIGEGFRAFLKDSDGNIVMDLGTNRVREFSFTRPNPGIPPFISYSIAYENTDRTIAAQYITSYVIFYPKT
jgi:hypothetical protein